MKRIVLFFLHILVCGFLEQEVVAQNAPPSLKGMPNTSISSSNFSTLFGINKEIGDKDKVHPKRLYIGDKVVLDSIEFDNVRNYPGARMKLSDFKGKFIILDFWSKYCTVCISAFPKMERLQEQFKDDIQILLVTADTEGDLASLFLKSTNVKETKLPMIIGDPVLKELFPHGGVPYHVWLDRGGQVVATTYGEETTAKNLEDLIADRPLHLAIKNEVFDKDLIRDVKNKQISFLQVGGGLFLPHLKYFSEFPIPRKSEKYPLSSSLSSKLSSNRRALSSPFSFPYYSLFMDFIPGDIVWQNNFHTDTTGKVNGFRIFNKTVDELFMLAYVDPKVKIERIIAEGKAKLLYEELSTDSTSSMLTLVNNKYSYESSLPVYSLDGARKLLQRDLSRFLGMEAVLEDRPLKCLVLKRLGTGKDQMLWASGASLSEDYKEERRTKEGFLFKNIFFLGFLTTLRLSNMGMDYPPIVDETGFEKEMKYATPIDIKLKCSSLSIDLQNLDNLRNALAEYGLGLSEEIRTKKVLILNSVF